MKQSKQLNSVIHTSLMNQNRRLMMTMATSMKTQKRIAPMRQAERVHVVCTHTHESPSVNTFKLDLRFNLLIELI